MIRHTRFERLVITWVPEIVLWVTYWSAITGLWVAAATWVYPGLPTAEVWVQIGWALLICVAAGILALIVEGLVERRAKYWADQRAVGRWAAWLADQWEVGR